MRHAGFHARQQFLKNDTGNGRHVEMGGFLDWHPSELDQLEVRTDDTLDCVCD